MLKFRQELEEWSREYTEEEWTGKSYRRRILLAGRLR